MKLRTLRRDRAARAGPELFLLDRVFGDCIERLELVQHEFRRALLIGCPNPAWRDRLGSRAASVDVADPGPRFASNAGGEVIVEDTWEPPEHAYDLVLAIGTLDTVNDLARGLEAVRKAMRAGGLFLGAIAGGNTLPRLRSAMLAADQVTGAASPRVHPRIEASALSPLLSNSGFVTPVVDVDRVQVAYRSLQRLVSDLRKMGATNILEARSRQPLSRRAAQAAAENFARAGEAGRSLETFEILHFACWTASPFSE